MTTLAALRAELADLLICPISQETMEDPVIDPCGHTFEAIQIQGWLSLNPTCPLSKRHVTIEQLVPNRMLKHTLEILAHLPPPEEREPMEHQGTPRSIVAHFVNLTDEEREILNIAITKLREQRARDARDGTPDRLPIPQSFGSRVKAKCHEWYKC